MHVGVKSNAFHQATVDNCCHELPEAFQ